MERWRCMVCEYTYDPSMGDPSQDVPPGMAFEDLPEYWVCPDCGVGAEDFESVEE